MSELWYYAHEGKPQGPVERHVVEELYRKGFGGEGGALVVGEGGVGGEEGGVGHLATG